MRRLMRILFLSVAILAAGCMAAGCTSSVKSAIASISPTRSSTTPGTITSTAAGPTATTASPTVTTATPTVTTTVTAPTPTAASSSAVAGQSVTAAPSGSPAASGGTGTNLLWLWILLGALVLVGLIVLIVRSSRRRSATAAGWQSRIIDAYAKGSALHDAMSVAETPGALAAGDAGARWVDIQRRSDDLAQTLYALRESAPDEENRARAADALASLQAVRSAMDAERAPGGAGAEYAEVVRSRLRTFEASLRALRGVEQPPL